MDSIGEEIHFAPELLKHRESSDSKDDVLRHVELWTTRLDERLLNWLSEMKKNMVLHNKASKRKKALYRGLFLPSAIIPLTLGILTPYIEQDYMIIVAIFLCIASILTSVNAFMDYGSGLQKHLHTEYQLSRLTHRIESILAEKKADRAQAKTVMTEIRYELDHINSSAPDL